MPLGTIQSFVLLCELINDLRGLNYEENVKILIAGIIAFDQEIKMGNVIQDRLNIRKIISIYPNSKGLRLYELLTLFNHTRYLPYCRVENSM